MKLKDRGFWVSNHFYWQSMAYYFFYSARFRSFTFFSACDPAIDMGGMLDENKSDIYDLLPHKYVPITLKTNGGDKIHVEALDELSLSFPLIVKPNVGFRGYKVSKVENIEDLNQFVGEQNSGREWLIQEYLDYKKEYSLLYYRIPGTNQKGIGSLVEKIYPQVTGDGVKNLQTLIEEYINPFLDGQVVHKRWNTKYDSIPAKGEKIVLDEIGNYERGSKFYSLLSTIDSALLDATEQVFNEVTGLDFFRMDFKADSIEAYKNGQFKILEINGTKSEPIHIYDPSTSFLGNTITIHNHWMTIRDIVKARWKKEGYTFPTTAYGLKSLFAIKKLVK